MKAFITQVDLVQSTNSPIVVYRSNIYKYEINPVNNTKCALSGYSSRADNAKSNGASPITKTQNSRCNEAAKRDSAMTPDDNAKKPANQCLKKPHHSVAADSTKHNIMEMGMFFLSRPDMKASDVFPKVWLSWCVSISHARVESALGRIALSYTPGGLVT
jgi:hypothetical protein